MQPRVITAVWGLESNFGRFAGVRPTIPALATLAYDPRRATLFRNELFSALEIVNRGDIELERLKGSWAGALGQPQFMPSSVSASSRRTSTATDAATSGSSQGDVFASVAHYLKEHGWSAKGTWGREVRDLEGCEGKARCPSAPDGGLPRRTRADHALPLKEWAKLGVRTTDGAALPAGAIDASIVTDGARYFLVYPN